MNKLSSTKMFQDVAKEFRDGSILKTLKKAAEEVNKYTVDLDLYDFMLKTIRTQFSFPLTRMIVNSALAREIIPALFEEAKSGEVGLRIPPMLNTMVDSLGKRGYVDISPIAKYERYANGDIELLDVDPKKFYAYLHFAFIEFYCRKYASILDKSMVFCRNVALAYGNLFHKCIDKNFPVAADTDNLNLSIVLGSIYAMVTFFDYSYTDAKNIILSDTKNFKRKEIEAISKTLDTNVITNDFEAFLAIYTEEFSSCIKKGLLNTRYVVGIWDKMYGANAHFALNHSVSFIKMITSVSIGFYQDFAIKKVVEKEIETVEEQMKMIFTR